jgi:Glu-tRNA(Gln) amidotransferase subunit E-like FAD-binding protein
VKTLKTAEQHVRAVATRNGLSFKTTGKGKRATFTVSQNDAVLFSAASLDDVDYF